MMESFFVSRSNRKTRNLTEIHGGIFRGRGDPNRSQRKLTEINRGPRHKAGEKSASIIWHLSNPLFVEMTDNEWPGNESDPNQS